MLVDEISKKLGAELDKEGGKVVMLEIPTNTYFQTNIETVKYMLDQGFECVYISLHRPFKNIDFILSENGLDTAKIHFIDVAAAFAKDKEKSGDSRCTSITEEIPVDELIRALLSALPKLKGGKKVIFMDSLTTFLLYKPLSDLMRFSEFLVRTIKTGRSQVLLFNVAKDLSQKTFIKDIAFHTDIVISIEDG